MNRILESELMEDERQSLAYARADFSASNQLFVDSLLRDGGGPLRSVVDIGCGPGDVVIRLARAAPAVHITAVDGSTPMLALARDAVAAAGLADRITLVHGRMPGVRLPDHAYDAVLSKDLLHHLPDPARFWPEVARLGRPGALVHVMDLVRPSTPDDARGIVEAVAASEDPVLREDFYNSLCAAFTIDEVRRQLLDAGINLRVEPIGDRHMVVTGRLT